jgi:hypothetical protein
MEVAMIIEFTGISKNKVVKKAMDYWYKNISNNLSLHDFFVKCSIRKDEIGYTIKFKKGEKIKL